MVSESLVRYWCSVGFLEINKYLRTGKLSERNKGDEEFFQEDADKLIAAASQHFGAFVYRGTTGNFDGWYSDKGISAWTTDVEVAKKIAAARSQQNGEPSLVIKMYALKGFDLQSFVESKGMESTQSEVLIAPGVYEVEKAL